MESNGVLSPSPLSDVVVGRQNDYNKLPLVGSADALAGSQSAARDALIDLVSAFDLVDVFGVRLIRVRPRMGRPVPSWSLRT